MWWCCRCHVGLLLLIDTKLYTVGGVGSLNGSVASFTVLERAAPVCSLADTRRKQRGQPRKNGAGSTGDKGGRALPPPLPTPLHFAHHAILTKRLLVHTTYNPQVMDEANRPTVFFVCLCQRSLPPSSLAFSTANSSRKLTNLSRDGLNYTNWRQ